MYLCISIYLTRLLHQNMQVSNCIKKDISILFQTHYRSSACIPWPGEFLQLQPWWHAATPGHQCQETGGRSQKSTTSQHQQQQWRVGRRSILPKLLSSSGTDQVQVKSTSSNNTSQALGPFQKHQVWSFPFLVTWLPYHIHMFWCH